MAAGGGAAVNLRHSFHEVARGPSVAPPPIEFSAFEVLLQCIASSDVLRSATGGVARSESRTAAAAATVPRASGLCMLVERHVLPAIPLMGNEHSSTIFALPCCALRDTETTQKLMEAEDGLRRIFLWCVGEEAQVHRAVASLQNKLSELRSNFQSNLSVATELTAEGALVSLHAQHLQEKSELAKYLDEGGLDAERRFETSATSSARARTALRTREWTHNAQIRSTELEIHTLQHRLMRLKSSAGARWAQCVKEERHMGWKEFKEFCSAFKVAAVLGGSAMRIMHLAFVNASSAALNSLIEEVYHSKDSTTLAALFEERCCGGAERRRRRRIRQKMRRLGHSSKAAASGEEDGADEGGNAHIGKREDVLSMLEEIARGEHAPLSLPSGCIPRKLISEMDPDGDGAVTRDSFLNAMLHDTAITTLVQDPNTRLSLDEFSLAIVIFGLFTRLHAEQRSTNVASSGGASLETSASAQRLASFLEHVDKTFKECVRLSLSVARLPRAGLTDPFCAANICRSFFPDERSISRCVFERSNIAEWIHRGTALAAQSMAETSGLESRVSIPADSSSASNAEVEALSEKLRQTLRQIFSIYVKLESDLGEKMHVAAFILFLKDARWFRDLAESDALRVWRALIHPPALFGTFDEFWGVINCMLVENFCAQTCAEPGEFDRMGSDGKSPRQRVLEDSLQRLELVFSVYCLRRGAQRHGLFRGRSSADESLAKAISIRRERPGIGVHHAPQTSLGTLLEGALRMREVPPEVRVRRSKSSERPNTAGARPVGAGKAAAAGTGRRQGALDRGKRPKSAPSHVRQRIVDRGTPSLNSAAESAPSTSAIAHTIPQRPATAKANAVARHHSPRHHMSWSRGRRVVSKRNANRPEEAAPFAPPPTHTHTHPCAELKREETEAATRSGACDANIAICARARSASLVQKHGP